MKVKGSLPQCQQIDIVPFSASRGCSGAELFENGSENERFYLFVLEDICKNRAKSNL